MPSSILQIRRSPEAVVSTVVPSEGELAYTTDTKKLSIGDGVTLGGNGIVMDSQLATDTLAGIVEKATTAEAQAATADKFPDAAGVKSYVDQFGIGKSSGSPITDADADTLVYTGVYRTGPTWTGSVYVGTNGANQGTLYHAQSYTDLTYSTQLWMRMQDTEIHIRHKNNGVWSQWSKCYLNTNIVGTVSQSGGIPTGAIIETGSNANGTYTKFADGTMICRHLVATASIACTTADTVFGFKSPNQTWTYPAALTSLVSYQISGLNTPVTFATTVGNNTTAQYVWHSAGSSAATTRYAGLLVTGRWY